MTVDAVRFLCVAASGTTAIQLKNGLHHQGLVADLLLGIDATPAVAADTWAADTPARPQAVADTPARPQAVAGTPQVDRDPAEALPAAVAAPRNTAAAAGCLQGQYS